MRYPDDTSSGLYILAIRNGSPLHYRERTLAGILSQHAGKVVAGDVGGSFSGSFYPSYIRIPAVEAVVRQGLVKDMRINRDA